MRGWFSWGRPRRAEAGEHHRAAVEPRNDGTVYMADGDTYCAGCARETYGSRVENAGKVPARWTDGWDNPIWVVPADHVWLHRVFCARCGREVAVRIRRGA